MHQSQFIPPSKHKNLRSPMTPYSICMYKENGDSSAVTKVKVENNSMIKIIFILNQRNECFMKIPKTSMIYAPTRPTPEPILVLLVNEVNEEVKCQKFPCKWYQDNCKEQSVDTAVPVIRLCGRRLLIEAFTWNLDIYIERALALRM